MDIVTNNICVVSLAMTLNLSDRIFKENIFFFKFVTQLLYMEIFACKDIEKIFKFMTISL